MENSNPQPGESPAAGPPPSLGSSLVNVIASPGEAYEQLRPSPARTSTWLVPGLLLILVSWIGAAIVFSQDAVKQQIADIQEQALQRQVEKGKLTQEQAGQFRERAVQVGGIVMMVMVCAVPLVEAVVTPFWWGLLLWLIGGAILKGQCRYLKAVEVAGLANMIAALGAVLKTLLILVTGSLFAGPNPSLLIPNFDPGIPWQSAVLNLDLITFWVVAVRGLGIAKVSGVPVGKAIGLTAAFWTAQTGFFVGLGWAMQRIFGG